MTEKPTIDIIDDDAAMRDSLAFLLDVNGYGPRPHDSVTAFLDVVKTSLPDCVITDIRMPGMSGLDLVRKLKSDGVVCPVIAITGHGDVALAVEAMKAGVVDFIEKPFDDSALLGAIRSAIAAKPHELPDAKRDDAIARLASLSPRERDVLQGLASGKINKVIAHDLGISPRTVEVYRANLMVKTAARSMSELMRLALAAGL